MDHSAAYGVHNQNMWMPVSRPQSDVPPSDTTQQSLVNQSKHASDSWKDPWDWNLDQQSDTQQQQPPPPSQQQQPYVSSYQNQGQMLSGSVQNHYYKNLNGNTSDVLNQNSVSGRNTPRSEPARQTGSTYTDSFPPYANYNKNQQYPLLLRQSNAKSGYEHAQWPNEHQSQNAAYAPQSQKDQAPMHPPPMAPHSNYNWGKDDVTNLSLQRNWQNHTDTPSQWQDQNMPQELQQPTVDSIGNQCGQPSQMYDAPVEMVNKEHSMNWSADGQQGNEASNKSNVPNQWHNQNRESQHQSAHLVQTNNLDDTFALWPQSGNTSASHDWRHSNVQSESVHSTQWLQPTGADNSSFAENMPQNNNNARFAANEWQQMHMAPFNYVPTSTTVPTTAENIVHTPTKNEQENEKQAAVASIASTMSPHDSINYAKSSDVKSPIGDHHNPNVLIDDAPKSDLSRTVFTSEKDDRTFPPTATEELTSNFGQLNLDNKSGKHMEPLGESLEIHSSPMEGRAQHPVNFNVRGNSVPDNIPVLPPDYAPSSIENSHFVDSQPAVGQDHLIPNTYQSGATKITDSVSQSGYDQWYNQNTLDNAWYAKDHSRPPPKQWNTPEQNVENYENIQQTSDFINVEVVAPALKERDIYGSRDSINKETLDNDPKPSVNPKEATNIRDFREEVSNVEVPSMQQQQLQVRPHPPLAEQMPDNYEFASNDRNTFLETGELTDSHQEHEPTPPSQDDENDEVPNDIPFLREVPGQSSTIDPRRNDPTGQEQSMQVRSITDRVERRDVLPGQERNVPLLLRGDSDTLERRNDPSGRERSLPPQQSRNDPSGEERYQLQAQIMLEPSETREVLGRGNEPDEVVQQTDAELRQIPGGASSNDVTQLPDDRTTGGRVVTGSPPEIPPAMVTMQDQASESRSKREEAVGAPLESESQGISGSSNRRDSYEDEEDEGSRNSRDESRERRRETSPDRRRYEFDRKNTYYERDREYEDDYYYERRRVGDNDRQYNARDDFERRDVPYRDDERKHQSRDDLDRHGRDDMDRRVRGKEDVDERDGRRRPDERRRGDDPRRRDRDPRDYDARYSRDPRDREYMDRDRRRDDRRPRRYDDYDIRDPYRRDYYDDPYGRRYKCLNVQEISD